MTKNAGEKKKKKEQSSNKLFVGFLTVMEMDFHYLSIFVLRRSIFIHLAVAVQAGFKWKAVPITSIDLKNCPLERYVKCAHIDDQSEISLSSCFFVGFHFFFFFLRRLASHNELYILYESHHALVTKQGSTSVSLFSLETLRRLII